MLGAFRALGYGSLYPCLKGLLVQGLIAEEAPPGAPRATQAGRRSKIVYQLTADGKEQLQDLLSQAGPAAWEDDGFGVHFAFFGQTPGGWQVTDLEGRRCRLEGAAGGRPLGLARDRERLDSYTLELQGAAPPRSRSDERSAG